MTATLQHKSGAFEVQDVTAAGTFSGYGSVYGNVDSYQECMAGGCFKDSLEAWSAKGAMPAMLWQHRSGEPVGVYTAMREDDRGLYVEGRLALKTQRGAEAYELLSMKAIGGLSIGFVSRDDSVDKATKIRTIKKADLWEVSLVTFPANDQARVDQVKAVEDIQNMSDVERYLREVGGATRSEAKAMTGKLMQLARREVAGGVVTLDSQAITEALQRRIQVLAA